MANPNAVHEPSMEEILASIRQIISEDGGSAAPKIDGVVAEPASAARTEEAAPMAKHEPVSFAAPDPPIEEVEADISPQPDFRPFMGRETFEEALEPERGPMPLRAPTITPRIQSEDDEGQLLSDRSGDAISGAFGALAHTILAQNARTLEEVVTEMLQPMLKQWLDDNLPTIVERKVREEIERVSRGRR